MIMPIRVIQKPKSLEVEEFRIELILYFVCILFSKVDASIMKLHDLTNEYTKHYADSYINSSFKIE